MTVDARDLRPSARLPQEPQSTSSQHPPASLDADPPEFRSWVMSVVRRIPGFAPIRVLRALVTRARKRPERFRGRIWFPLRALCLEAQLSRRAVQYALHTLERLGVIRLLSGGGRFVESVVFWHKALHRFAWDRPDPVFCMVPRCTPPAFYTSIPHEESPDQRGGDPPARPKGTNLTDPRDGFSRRDQASNPAVGQPDPTDPVPRPQRDYRGCRDHVEHVELATPEARDALWRRLVRTKRVPDTPAARLDVHRLAIWAIRVAKSPGALFAWSMIRGLWSRGAAKDEDLAVASIRSVDAAAQKCAPAVVRSPREVAKAREWTEERRYLPTGNPFEPVGSLASRIVAMARSKSTSRESQK